MFSLKLKQSMVNRRLLKYSLLLNISPTGNITTSGCTCLLCGVKVTDNLHLFHQLNHVHPCLFWWWWAQAARGHVSVQRFSSLLEASAPLWDAAAICLVQRRLSAALRRLPPPAQCRAEPAGQVGLAQQLPEALHHVDVVFGGWLHEAVVPVQLHCGQYVLAVQLPLALAVYFVGYHHDRRELVFFDLQDLLP